MQQIQFKYIDMCQKNIARSQSFGVLKTTPNSIYVSRFSSEKGRKRKIPFQK